MTTLLTVAHGTRDPEGNAVAAAVTIAAGHRLGMSAETTYVELCEPLFADVVRDLPPSAGPVAVVPLLLSTGYHLRHDLPAAVATAGPEVRLGGALGPDPLLAAAMVDRLTDAGAEPGQPLVMVAAGSNDPHAEADLTGAVDLLALAWGGPVRLATLAGRGERVEAVVRPDDAVAPYLLAPGHFATRCRELALAAGATAVAEPIGPHPRLVDLVVDRATALADAVAV